MHHAGGSSRVDTLRRAHTHDAPAGGNAPSSPPPDPSTVIDLRDIHAGNETVASAFLTGPGIERIALPGRSRSGIVRVRHYALMATGPSGPIDARDEALDALLAIIRRRRLHPVFATVADPAPFVRRGLFAYPMSEEAIVDIGTFGLGGARMASIRHSVTSARRAGMRVVPWTTSLADEVHAVSDQWLHAKHGPEGRFIVGRFEPDMPATLDCRVALDADGSVAGFVTWRLYARGKARGLDLMRRREGAPNPTMDLLIADSLLGFADEGVETASLACVQRSFGALAERVYPTRPLRKYKDKFAPDWQPRWVIVPSRRHLPTAALALLRACVPGGLPALLNPFA